MIVFFSVCLNGDSVDEKRDMKDEGREREKEVEVEVKVEVEKKTSIVEKKKLLFLLSLTKLSLRSSRVSHWNRLW